MFCTSYLKKGKTWRHHELQSNITLVILLLTIELLQNKSPFTVDK